MAAIKENLQQQPRTKLKKKISIANLDTEKKTRGSGGGGGAGRGGNGGGEVKMGRELLINRAMLAKKRAARTSSSAWRKGKRTQRGNSVPPSFR